MEEEIAVENGRISDFRGFVSLTLTLDRVILHVHTVMHHSSTSIYTPNFIEIEETLWTDGRTGGRTFETHFIRSTQRSRPNKGYSQCSYLRISLVLDAVGGQWVGRSLRWSRWRHPTGTKRQDAFRFSSPDGVRWRIATWDSRLAARHQRKMIQSRMSHSDVILWRPAAVRPSVRCIAATGKAKRQVLCVLRPVLLHEVVQSVVGRSTWKQKRRKTNRGKSHTYTHPHTIIYRPSTICVSQNCELRTGGFCERKALSSTNPCWRDLPMWPSGQSTRVPCLRSRAWNRSVLSREWKRKGGLNEPSEESEEEEVMVKGIGESEMEELVPACRQNSLTTCIYFTLFIIHFIYILPNLAAGNQISPGSNSECCCSTFSEPAVCFHSHEVADCSPHHTCITHTGISVSLI